MALKGERSWWAALCRNQVLFSSLRSVSMARAVRSDRSGKEPDVLFVEVVGDFAVHTEDAQDHLLHPERQTDHGGDPFLPDVLGILEVVLLIDLADGENGALDHFAG